MANYVVSIAVDAVIEALGAFLVPFVGAAQILRSQVNRVAMPPGAFVELTELLQVDLETPITVEDAASASITGPKRIDIQIDFYGPDASDQCAAVKTVFRSQYAPAQFPAGIAPLYCSDGIQAPLINAEQQYESRWTLTASLQYNPTVIIPSQSANALAVNILEDIP
jgi:hypothetical protein